MRLLASTDFALRLLMRLAADPARHRTTEDLAQAVGVPRNHPMRREATGQNFIAPNSQVFGQGFVV